MLHKICFKLNGWKLNLQNGNCMIYTEGVSKVDVLSMLESRFGTSFAAFTIEKIVILYSVIMNKVLRLIRDRIASLTELPFNDLIIYPNIYAKYQLYSLHYANATIQAMDNRRKDGRKVYSGK
uniref:Uncharacterized protein n=1 Tax=Glossina pallidipes TaxID=7398 RepID=A0A1B0AFF5_GLOPL